MPCAGHRTAGASFRRRRITRCDFGKEAPWVDDEPERRRGCIFYHIGRCWPRLFGGDVMNRKMFRKRALAAVLLGLALLIGLTATPTVLSGDGPPALPDLVPMGLNFNVSVTNRLGGPTLEFPILTANIGGQHFTRPRDPDTQQYLVRQVYQYDLYWYDPDVGDYTGPIDSRRKNTICMIDDGNRGRRVFQCIADRLNPFYTCGGTNGVSRGWADDYFRGLQGQWSF